MKKTISLAIACLAFASCNLDLIPENGLTHTNAFQTETELNATTSSIHFFINSYIEGSPVFLAAGAKVDETQYSDGIRNWNPHRVVNSETDWKGLYDIIFEANLLLDNIGQTENLSEERYNFHSGQAEFALGLAYFLLAQQYGDCVITKDSKSIIEYGISPISDVINTALEHAEKGYKLLPVFEQLKTMDGNNATSKQFASKGSCAALLAHIYAWKGSMIELYKLEGDAKEAYLKSIEYATVLTDGKAGNYSLCSSPEELCKRLSTSSTTNPEAIFVVTYDYGRSEETSSPNRVAAAFTGWPVDETRLPGNFSEGTDFKLLKTTIKEMYEEKDARLKAFFYNMGREGVGEDKVPEYAVMYKFREAVYKPDAYSEFGKVFISLNADFVYWRLADIILLRAECYNKVNEKEKAAKDLNAIRGRAGASLYPAAGESDLQLAIFKERERELIGETDCRYFDVLRNNYIKTELEGKFKQLTDTEIKNGALFVPVPKSAYIDKNGRLINTKIRQKAYWIPYM